MTESSAFPLSNDDGFTTMAEAGRRAGVGQSTILRWFREGLFAEDEVYRQGNSRWLIEVNAVCRVRDQKATKGGGALKARWAHFPPAAKGYVALPIVSLDTPTLDQLRNTYHETAEILRERLSATHPRVLLVQKKIAEIDGELAIRQQR